LQLQPLDAPAARNAPGLRPWVLRIQGRYPAACDVREWPLLWAGDGPGDHTLRVLLQTWLDLGGEWQGRIQESPWPEGLAVWQRWTSPPLAQLVRDINKFSNNVMARQVFLSLGRTQSERLPPASGATAELANGAQAPRQAATLPRAREAVARQVRADTAPPGALAGPCEGQALQLDNGSGLSRAERTSAACLGRWLQAMWRSSVMPEFIASLPVTGIDGTTRRWRAAEGSAHLKTGSLDGVATLAGYVLGTSGQRHVLVAMVNHPRAEAARPALLALIDAVQQAPDTHAPDR
jgi:D-alanyl-D-alanine carboxypeptidase/D-alanyl-D-alanine-endopeptidase (penicillin-binding protein 4)